MAASAEFNLTRSDSLTSYQLHNLYQFEFYVLGVGTVVLCLFGIVGNVLSLIVLTRRGMVSTTYTYLVALALSDITVLVTGTLAVCLRTIGSGYTEILIDHTIVPYVYPLLVPAALTCVYTSVWITVALTLDRYLAVCHAMNTRIHCSVPSTRKSIVVIVIIALLYNIPTFFEYKIIYTYGSLLNNDTNQTVAVLIPTEVGSHPVFREVYHTWIYVPVVWGIPFTVMSYMNIRLAHAVRKSKQTCKLLGQRPPKGIDVTVMLIAVIVIFLICQTPYMVCVTMRALNPDIINSVVFIKFEIVTTLLIILNSSVNFLVYTLFGKRFRAKFLHMFCGSKYKDYMHALSQSYNVRSENIELNRTSRESVHKISKESVLSDWKKSNTDCSRKERQPMMTVH